jgi:hypothetical protein
VTNDISTTTADKRPVQGLELVQAVGSRAEGVCHVRMAVRDPEHLGRSAERTAWNTLKKLSNWRKAIG